MLHLAPTEELQLQTQLFADIVLSTSGVVDGVKQVKAATNRYLPTFGFVFPCWQSVLVLRETFSVHPEKSQEEFLILFDALASTSTDALYIGYGGLVCYDAWASIVEKDAILKDKVEPLRQLCQKSVDRAITSL